MALQWAKDAMSKWRIGYPKGKHRITDEKLAAIKEWESRPRPKAKVRELAAELAVSPTTVYKVLAEIRK